MDSKPIVRPDVSSSTQGMQALGKIRTRGKGECSQPSPRSLRIRQVLLGSSLWDQAAYGEPFMFCRWQPTLIADMALDLDCLNGSI